MRASYIAAVLSLAQDSVLAFLGTSQIRSLPVSQQQHKGSSHNSMRVPPVHCRRAALAGMQLKAQDSDDQQPQEQSNGQRMPVYSLTGISDEEQDGDGRNSDDLTSDGNEPESLSAWSRTQQALGLGPWSFAALGLALVIIVCNNSLGPGWAGRLLSEDGASGALAPPLPYNVVPLNRPENMLQ